MTRKQIAKLSDKDLSQLLEAAMTEKWRRGFLAIFKRKPFPTHAGDTIRKARRAMVRVYDGSPKPYDIEELRLAGV
jgi:hypothetical protein